MIKKILKSILIFCSILISLFLLLIIVNLIPRNYIKNNVKDSLYYFISEGNFPKIKYAYNYVLDNYTDSLMINTAYSVDSNKPLESAMLMRRNYRPNENLKLKNSGNDEMPIYDLIQSFNENNDTYFQYQRYWHGYMIILRPLLVFFNYKQIRILLITTIIILSLILVYLAYKKIDIYASIATLFMLIVSNFIFIGLSMQYSSVFIIMLISSIYIITKCKEKNDKQMFDVFLVIGMLTSFFDLLTTPLLTFGIPVIYYIVLKNKENNLSIKSLLKVMIAWGLGYGLIWLSKWIICDSIYNTGTIKEAFYKIFLQTNSTELFNVTALKAIKRNFSYINRPIILFAIFTVVLTLINKKIIKMNILILMLGLLPFLWFAIVKNHSFIHARFTFRDLLITLFALITITMYNIKNIIEAIKQQNLKVQE